MSSYWMVKQDKSMPNKKRPCALLSNAEADWFVSEMLQRPIMNMNCWEQPWEIFMVSARHAVNSSLAWPQAITILPVVSILHLLSLKEFICSMSFRQMHRYSGVPPGAILLLPSLTHAVTARAASFA